MTQSTWQCNRQYGRACHSTTALSQASEPANAYQPYVHQQNLFFPENQLQNITQKQHTQPLASIASFYPTQFFSFSSFVTVTLCHFYYIIMVGPVFLLLCLFPVPSTSSSLGSVVR